MESTGQRPRQIFQIAILVLAALLGVIHLTDQSQGPLIAVLTISSLFIAFLANFPFRIIGPGITLIHVVTLGTGILYGPTAAIGAVIIGIPLAKLFPFVLPRVFPREYVGRDALSRIFVDVAIGLIPLGITFGIFDWMDGISNLQAAPELYQIVAISLTFAGLHLSLVLTDFFFYVGVPRRQLGQNIALLILTELVPLPFLLLIVVAFPSSQFGSLAALGGIPAVLSIVLHSMARTQSTLERRLQDLTTIERVSAELRSTTDMESLLSVIHQQVSRLLQVESFYVALYEPSKAIIWYPLAVKYGVRRTWPARSLADRLTDRVILEGEPIILPRNAREELRRIGLPPGEEAMNSWLGVPLITPERTIGCLAVFSAAPTAEVTASDLNLLTILSGQASVAINNAILFDQLRERAHQVENLNEISALITESLDLGEVLAKVCQAVIQVGGGQKSAIALTAEDGSKVNLAHTNGLSEAFVRPPEDSSVNAGYLSPCLATGSPYLVHDLSEAELDGHYLDRLQQEAIAGFGDFPLPTPDGQIGYLSVFFEERPEFSADQLELLETLASQAALAVANARLYAQTDLDLSQRVRQLSIIETIGRELAAVTYSDQLFDLILDFGLEYTGATWGSMVLYQQQQDQIQIKASRGYREAQTEFSGNFGITSRTIQQRQPIIVNDVSQDADFMNLTGEEIGSQLSTPLIRNNQVLGALTLESPDLNAFDQADQAFISQLANQAAVALLNAQLYEETQRHLREQTSLYNISTQLVGNLALENVLDILTSTIGEMVQAGASGAYQWIERSQSYSRLTMNLVSSRTTHQPLPERLDSSLLGTLQSELQGSNAWVTSSEHPSLVEAFEICEGCQLVLFPITTFNRHFGVVAAHIGPEHVQTNPNLRLPEAIVAQASIAIQNAQLFEHQERDKNRLEAVLDSVGDGVLMIDTEGLITLANEPIERLADLPSHTLHGAAFDRVPINPLRTLGYTPVQAQNLLEDLRAEKIPAVRRVVVERNIPPPTKILESITVPVWSQLQRIIGVIIVVRDITEEHEISQAREMITQTLVHDLKSPMGTIQNALELLDEATTTAETRSSLVDQSISIANRATDRVLGLVDSLLDIARMESGEMHLEWQETDVAKMINQTLVDFMPQAQSIGIVITAEMEPNIPDVLVDREKFGRILMNLIDNALKFTPTGKQISIAACRHGDDQIRIQVVDNGPGIPEGYQNQIFDRFGQVPGQLGRRRGSGLGLTFCKLAVEAHGGRIWYEAPSEGGSLFAFTLPIQPAGWASKAESGA
jgi:signal transduction histidine kinase/transcriptional regulator with GAF, ATPase, and Fis domain